MNDEGLHMIVHFDPISTKDNTVNELRIWIGEKVKEIDERLTIHDLRIVYGITHTNVIFDCVVPDVYKRQVTAHTMPPLPKNVISGIIVSRNGLRML